MPPPASVSRLSGDDTAPYSTGSRGSDAEAGDSERRGGREEERDEEEEEYEEEEEEYEEIEVEEEVEVDEEEEEEEEVEEEEVEEEEEEEEAEKEEEPEEDEEEEEPEEEEEEEEELVKEDEVEEEEEVEEDSRLHVNPDMETWGVLRHQESHSTPEKSEPKTANSSLAISVCGQNLLASQNIAPMVQTEVIEEKDKDPSSCKSENLLITVSESNDLDSAVNGNGLEAMMIKENPNELRGPCGSASIKLSDHEEVAAKPTSSCSMPPQDSVTPLTTRDSVDERSHGDFELGADMSMDMDLDDDNEPAAISVASSGVRPRSQSPTLDLNNGAKRPAVICDFFARGWCIKGSSCRFLHVKNEAKKPDKEIEKGAAAAKLVKEDHLGGGKNFLLDNGQSQRFQRSGDKYQFSSLQLNDLSSASSTKATSKDDPMVPSFEDARLQTFERNQPSSAHGSCETPTSRGNSLLKNSGIPYSGFSSCSYVVPGNHNKAYVSNVDDQLSSGGQYLRDPLLKASFSSSSMLSSHAVSARATPPFPSTYLDTSSLGSQSASPFSGSASKKLPITGIAGAHLHHAEHKAQISSNDWEPSVPFLPSFFITRTLISPSRVQYDPLQDSFDSPSSREPSFKFSFSFASQETHTLAPDKAHQQVHGDILVAPESNASSFSQVKDNLNEIKIDESDAGQKSDGARHKSKSKFKQSVEMEVEQKTNMDNQKDSKVSRYFRAALVEFTKEQLKPHWREGHVSKDVHNIIVKKAVEKVLSSFQPHQIPTTAESTEQYLSTSRPKISKLIEGYVTKYGRS